MLVDDHSLFRAGLAHLLSDYSDIEVVGEAGSSADAVSQALCSKPDVILMDVDMPGEDGIDATIHVKQVLPDTRVIMLTMYAQNTYLVHALRAGAHGYLLKDASADDVVATIRLVAQGGAVMSPRMARYLLDEFIGRDAIDTQAVFKPNATGLTSREAEVLSLISVGKTTREIASQLCLSDNTVKRHTSNIFQKLHVKHRSQAAVEAVRRGLTSGDLPPRKSCDLA